MTTIGEIFNKFALLNDLESQKASITEQLSHYVDSPYSSGNHAKLFFQQLKLDLIHVSQEIQDIMEEEV